MRILLILAVMVGMSYADDGHVHCGGEYHACCCCECYEYKVFCPQPEGLNWEDANDYCKSLPGGLGLATIDTQETFNKIRALIPTHWKGDFCGWGFWIGLRDLSGTDPHDADTFETLGTWECPMCEYYYEWAPGEPNDNHNKDQTPPGQNCVQMWYRHGNDGQYDDDYCDWHGHKHGFVCKIELDCPCDECHPYDKDM